MKIIERVEARPIRIHAEPGPRLSDGFAITEAEWSAVTAVIKMADICRCSAVGVMRHRLSEVLLKLDMDP